MEDIIIREMIMEDIDELSALYYDFWNEESDSQMMKQEFHNLIDNKDYIFLSAISNGILAGAVMGIVCHELYGKCKPFLVMEDFIVRSNCRNKGIGKKLLEKLEEIAEERGCSQIQFITEANRYNTIKFYEKCGYESNKNIGFKKKFLNLMN